MARVAASAVCWYLFATCLNVWASLGNETGGGSLAQIFISHSRRDTDVIHFLLEAFSGTKVKPHLEEFENEVPSGVNAKKIAADIQVSNALFVLLTENVQNLNHTRDWVNWECGTAVNKDIWVFEPFETLGRISIVIPRVNHYVLFETTEEWRKYLRSVIASYDDSHVLPTLSAATGGGALLGEGPGAALGFAVGLVGLLLANSVKPRFGADVKCFKCLANYKIHRYGNSRCPVCNSMLLIAPPQNPAMRIASTSLRRRAH